MPIFVIVCGEVRTFCDVSFLAGNAEQRVLFYCGVVSAMRLVRVVASAVGMAGVRQVLFGFNLLRSIEYLLTQR